MVTIQRDVESGDSQGERRSRMWVVNKRKRELHQHLG